MAAQSFDMVEGGKIVALGLMIVLLIGVLPSFPRQQAFAIDIAPDTDVANLLNALLGGGGAGIDLATVSGSLSANQDSIITSSGTYVNPTNTYGIGPGIVLSTGNVVSYNDGPNTDEGFTYGYFVPATPSQELLLDPITGNLDHFDVTELTINFDMESGFNNVFFNVVFGSEEFDEFVGTTFIDGFGLYVNGVNIATVDGSPVNINHPDMTFATGTELDALLGGSSGPSGPFVHTFSSPVNPAGNTITFIVADSSDDVLDTTVFISQLGGSPPIQPEISIDDVTMAEGNSGTKLFQFTVTRTGVITGDSFVEYETLDNTAVAPSDYSFDQDILAFAPDETTKTVSISVNGDLDPETDEIFFVHLFNCSGCDIIEDSGQGTILNDDLPPANLTIDPTSNNYGDRTTGTTSPFTTFTVTNTGQSTATNVEVALTGLNSDQFTLQNNTCTNVSLTEAQTCTVDAAFAPTSTGLKEASLDVSSTAGGTPSAALTGNGTPQPTGANLTIAPTSNDFGSVQNGSTSSLVQFIVTNTGDLTSTAIAMALTGTNADQFNILNDNCTGNTLAGSASCTVDAQFAPTSEGLMEASLDASATQGGTASTALSGTGTPIPTSPADGIRALIITAEGMGINADALGQAPTLLEDDNPSNDASACGKLGAFINHVEAQAGKKKLTVEQAQELIDDAHQIEEQLGC